MRKLAHIEKIVNIEPVYLLENNQPADSIELATVLGWRVVVKKGEYQVGDLAVFVEIDSILPALPEFDFLANRNYKIKTMKLNKFYYGNQDNRVVSQGILFKTDILNNSIKLVEGTDVTDLLKITKIEDETPEIAEQSKESRLKAAIQRHKFLRTKLGKYLMKKTWFRNIILKTIAKKKTSKNFPSYINKTDETRIQALPIAFAEWKKRELENKVTWIVTEKLDGTSTTFAIQKKNKKFDFAVCSRNVRQETPNQKTWYDQNGGAETNYYWEQAFKINAEKSLKYLFDFLKAEDHVILQGETIGPSIQGNRYKLKERQFFAFNLIVDGKKLSSMEARAILGELSINFVPILEVTQSIPNTIDEVVQSASGKTVVGSSDAYREGLVIRDTSSTISFKAISVEYLLKNDL